MKNGIICGDAMVEKTSKGVRMECSAAYSTGREYMNRGRGGSSCRRFVRRGLPFGAR